MTIRRRVTARFNKRVRRGPVSDAPSGALPVESAPIESVPVESAPVESVESNVQVLPIAEARSGPVATSAQATRPKATISRAIRLSVYLRDARGRAEEILREHSQDDGRTGATCQACLAAYPCDAVRAAQDVIAISEELHFGRLLSSRALLQLMTELVDLGDLEKAEADPRAPSADHGASMARHH